MERFFLKYRTEIISFAAAWILIVLIQGFPLNFEEFIGRLLGITLGECFYLLIKGVW